MKKIFVQMLTFNPLLHGRYPNPSLIMLALDVIFNQISKFVEDSGTHLVLSGIRVKFVSQSSGYYRSIYGSLIDNFLKELKYFRRQFWR